jgi:chromosome segregation ATPase
MKVIVTKKSDMKIHISSLENEIRKLKDEIKDLEKIEEYFRAENEELKAKYKTALDDNNTWLDTAFSLENKFNFERSELKQQISTLESKLEQEMKNPTNDYFIELEKKYKKLNSDFDKLKYDYDEYRYYCEDLEYENEEIKSENEKLKVK